MASIFAHFWVGVMYFLFPDRLDFIALLVASQLPDFEYYLPGIRSLIKTMSISDAHRKSKLGILHTFIGSMAIGVPLCLLINWMFASLLGYVFNLEIILVSTIIGISSHLVFDLPAHGTLNILWPLKVYDKNPLRFTGKKFKILNWLYEIGRPIEPYKLSDHIAGWNFVVFSNLILLVYLIPFL